MRRAHLVNDEFKEQLNRKSLKYNWHDAEVTVLEGIMARGDRKISKAIEEAYRLGCLFDSWTESFHNELWMQAFENTGVDIDFYNLRYRCDKKVPAQRMGSCDGRKSNSELPYAVFRMWRSEIWRRCLL